MAINTYLPRIPLKADKLNAPIRRHRVADAIKKPEPTQQAAYKRPTLGQRIPID